MNVVLEGVNEISFPLSVRMNSVRRSGIGAIARTAPLSAWSTAEMASEGISIVVRVAMMRVSLREATATVSACSERRRRAGRSAASVSVDRMDAVGSVSERLAAGSGVGAGSGVSGRRMIQKRVMMLAVESRSTPMRALNGSLWKRRTICESARRPYRTIWIESRGIQVRSQEAIMLATVWRKMKAPRKKGTVLAAMRPDFWENCEKEALIRGDPGVTGTAIDESGRRGVSAG